MGLLVNIIILQTSVLTSEKIMNAQLSHHVLDESHRTALFFKVVHFKMAVK